MNRKVFVLDHNPKRQEKLKKAWEHDSTIFVAGFLLADREFQKKEKCLLACVANRTTEFFWIVHLTDIENYFLQKDENIIKDILWKERVNENVVIIRGESVTEEQRQAYEYGNRKTIIRDYDDIEPSLIEIVRKWLNGETISVDDIGKADTISLLSILKHRIVNLFEPTNFDLQNVRIDIDSSGDNASAWALLQQILSMRQGKNYYQNLLNRAYYLALGEQEQAWMKMLDEMAKKNLNEWKRTKGVLPDEQAVLDLVRKEDQEGNAEWEKLYKLLGLQQENGEYILNEESPIRLFCEQMDCLKDNPPDKAPSISTLLNFFAENHDWSHVDIRTINTFYDWFSTLCDTMAAFRDCLNPPTP